MSDSQNTEDLEDEIKILRDRINELEKLKDKFEGAGVFVKLVFWVIGPAITFFLFVKDHWK